MQVLYSRGALFNNLITRVRLRVAVVYNLTGRGITSTTTADRVKWLMSKARFMYGDADAEVRFLFALSYSYL